jgi:hypothetical protein
MNEISANNNNISLMQVKNGASHKIDSDNKNKIHKDILFLTNHECNDIIKQTLHLNTANVIDYQLEKFDHDIAGYLGDYLRLKIVTENVRAEILCVCVPRKILIKFFFL